MRASRLIGFAVVGLLLLAGPQAIRLYTDWLWFGEVGYQRVFSTIWAAQSLLFVVTFAAAVAWFGVNIRLALSSIGDRRPTFVTRDGTAVPFPEPEQIWRMLDGGGHGGQPALRPGSRRTVGNLADLAQPGGLRPVRSDLGPRGRLLRVLAADVAVRPGHRPGTGDRRGPGVAGALFRHRQPDVRLPLPRGGARSRPPSPRAAGCRVLPVAGLGRMAQPRRAPARADAAHLRRQLRRRLCAHPRQRAAGRGECDRSGLCVLARAVEPQLAGAGWPLGFISS